MPAEPERPATPQPEQAAPKPVPRPVPQAVPREDDVSPEIAIAAKASGMSIGDFMSSVIDHYKEGANKLMGEFDTSGASAERTDTPLPSAGDAEDDLPVLGASEDYEASEGHKHKHKNKDKHKDKQKHKQKYKDKGDRGLHLGHKIGRGHERRQSEDLVRREAVAAGLARGVTTALLSGAEAEAEAKKKEYKNGDCVAWDDQGNCTNTGFVTAEAYKYLHTSGEYSGDMTEGLSSSCDPASRLSQALPRLPEGYNKPEKLIDQFINDPANGLTDEDRVTVRVAQASAWLGEHALRKTTNADVALARSRFSGAQASFLLERAKVSAGNGIEDPLPTIEQEISPLDTDSLAASMKELSEAVEALDENHLTTHEEIVGAMVSAEIDEMAKRLMRWAIGRANEPGNVFNHRGYGRHAGAVLVEALTRLQKRFANDPSQFEAAYFDIIAFGARLMYAGTVVGGDTEYASALMHDATTNAVRAGRQVEKAAENVKEVHHAARAHKKDVVYDSLIVTGVSRLYWRLYWWLRGERNLDATCYRPPREDYTANNPFGEGKGEECPFDPTAHNPPLSEMKPKSKGSEGGGAPKESGAFTGVLGDLGNFIGHVAGRNGVTMDTETSVWTSRMAYLLENLSAHGALEHVAYEAVERVLKAEETSGDRWRERSLRMLAWWGTGTLTGAAEDPFNPTAPYDAKRGVGPWMAKVARNLPTQSGQRAQGLSEFFPNEDVSKWPLTPVVNTGATSAEDVWEEHHGHGAGEKPKPGLVFEEEDEEEEEPASKDKSKDESKDESKLLEEAKKRAAEKEAAIAADDDVGSSGTNKSLKQSNAHFVAAAEKLLSDVKKVDDMKAWGAEIDPSVSQGRVMMLTPSTPQGRALFVDLVDSWHASGAKPDQVVSYLKEHVVVGSKATGVLTTLGGRNVAGEFVPPPGSALQKISGGKAKCALAPLEDAAAAPRDIGGLKVAFFTI